MSPTIVAYQQQQVQIESSVYTVCPGDIQNSGYDILLIHDVRPHNYIDPATFSNHIPESQA